MNKPIPQAAKHATAEMDLAYRMQKWPRALFKREAEDEGFLRKSIGMREEGTWPAVCRELFGRLYGIGTSKLDGDDRQPGAEWAEELHEQADAIPEWKALADRTQGDSWRSGIGAGQAAAVLANRVPELPEENQSALEAEAEMLREVMGEKNVNANLMEHRGELQRRIRAAQRANDKAVEQMRDKAGFPIRSALREAAQKAQEAIQEVDDGLNGLGCGSDASVFERRKLAAKLVDDERLRKIAVLAGRLRIQAARKQRTKTTREQEEIKSITQSDDIPHLLASEVGLLAQEATKPFLIQRIADKEALCYELGGSDTKTRGPIIFCIDNSGSMNGQRDEWSKAVALAMMEVARIQKRAFACYIFNTSPQHRYYFNAGEASFEKILDMLSVTPGGGTTIANALNLAADVIEGKPDEGAGHAGWKHGPKSDVVLVTDGEDPYSDYPTIGERFKALGASLFVMGVSTQIATEGSGVGSIATEVTLLNDLELKAANEKLDGVFSV